MFPFFCDLVNRNDKKELGKVITQAGRILWVLFVPVSMLFLIYSYPLVELLKMGHFSIIDAYRSGISMACYTLVLPAYALEMLLMQAFFANRKMLSVTVIGIFFSSLSILISYIGIIKLGANGTIALVVVALGYAISRIGKTITLGVMLKKIMPIFPTHETLIFMLKVIFMSAFSTLLCYFIFLGIDRITYIRNPKLFLLLKLVLGGTAAGVSYLMMCFVLKVKEPTIMLHWCLEKIKRKQ
jgi:peptidoglycan biosynthesis protein MviN/MurJ (putative lipid II flippase)